MLYNKLTQMSNTPLYCNSHEKGHSEPPQKGYAKIILQIPYIFKQLKFLSKSWLECSCMNKGHQAIHGDRDISKYQNLIFYERKPKSFALNAFVE